jgi:cell wall-associated NlpC family hydrolase
MMFFFSRLSSLPICASVLCGALWVSPARADVYHAVSGQETLATVAAKYKVSVATLRSANNLVAAENSVLGAMLLRVPSANSSSTNAAPIAAPVAASNSFGSSTVETASETPGQGFIGRTMTETVRAGDSWETIAARYRAAGHEVDAETLRQRNGWGVSPAAGRTVTVPLGQVAYASSNLAPRITPQTNSFPRTTTTASAQTAPKADAQPRNLGGGVYASGEMLPLAQDVTPRQKPVFGGANGGNTYSSRRGTLSSRGGYGQMARGAAGGQVRVLAPGEEASAPPAPRTRTATASTAYSQPVATGAGIARVASVVSRGAQIRRLPQSSAVTLFRCQPGTQLAVLRQSGIWSAVLMSDRSTGWLPSKYLKLTAQTVDVSTQVVANPGPGGSARYSVGRYSTEHPMVARALTWLGTPYVYGGNSRRGIDCSAMIQQSFRTEGVGLPRTAAQQALVGQTVPTEALKAGDRLYFSASGTRIDHTGLYMGDGLFVHASGSGRRVIVSSLFEPRNWNIYVGARR